jgi:CBS domain containing-hemolysin-like protein
MKLELKGTRFMVDRSRIVNALARSGRYVAAGAALLALSTPSFASISRGTLEHAADFISWVVLAVVPVAGIYVFWALHILPEKVAKKKQHPQKEAIHALCLLSLFFGGLLWPLAWLWAHTKPVFYRAAYGTDKAPPEDEDTQATPGHVPRQARDFANEKEKV